MLILMWLPEVVLFRRRYISRIYFLCPCTNIGDKSCTSWSSSILRFWFLNPLCLHKDANKYLNENIPFTLGLMRSIYNLSGYLHLLLKPTLNSQLSHCMPTRSPGKLEWHTLTGKIKLQSWPIIFFGIQIDSNSTCNSGVSFLFFIPLRIC